MLCFCYSLHWYALALVYSKVIVFVAVFSFLFCLVGVVEMIGARAKHTRIYFQSCLQLCTIVIEAVFAFAFHKHTQIVGSERAFKKRKMHNFSIKCECAQLSVSLFLSLYNTQSKSTVTIEMIWNHTKRREKYVMNWIESNCGFVAASLYFTCVVLRFKHL